MDISIWNNIKNSLVLKNSNNKPFLKWFEPTILISMDVSANGKQKFHLGVPTKLHRYWIETTAFDSICSEISSFCNNPFEIEVSVTGQNPLDLENPNALREMLEESDDHYVEQKSIPTSPKESQIGHINLNPSYIFSTFVVGKNNEFAHAASFNVAQNPGADGYNPLFICGPVGMGKTHLLNSVGNHIKDTYPHVRIVYFSAQRFFNECISSIRRGEMDKFRLKYRDNCDVLLVDDIQFFGRGEAVQEEFFHTLDELLLRKCQVVVASDRMPRDIQGLEDRIRSRLEWGLIADIQMPDIETRIAILRYKAEKMNLRLPEDVVSYVARVSKRSIRELEGNLNTIQMYASFRGLPINLELVKSILTTQDQPTTLTIEEIQKLVSDYYGIKISDIKGQVRSKPIVTARQVAMYLIKNHLDKSLQDIGRAFGGKDHSTVINAVRRVEDQLNKDSDLKNDINNLNTKINNRTGL